MKTRSILYGLISALLLLGFYFIILTLVSGWSFTLKQFDKNWYYIILLSIGFGIQIGLYTYIRCHPEFISGSGMLKSPKGISHFMEARVQHDKNGKVIAVSGTTSTAAMISCCSHYLVNILPVLGITGVVTFVSQYQTQLFWVGIVSNLAGIVYMISKVLKIRSSIRKET